MIAKKNEFDSSLPIAIAKKIKRVRSLARACRWLDQAIADAAQSAVQGVRPDRWNTERRQKQRLLLLITQQKLIEELL